MQSIFLSKFVELFYSFLASEISKVESDQRTRDLNRPEWASYMWNVVLEWDRIHKVETEEKAIPGRGTVRWKDGKQEWAECVWDSEA